MATREEIGATMTENVELYLSPVHAKQLVSDIILDLHLAGVVIEVLNKGKLDKRSIGWITYEPLIKENNGDDLNQV